jgi:hypothetical protein
MIYQIPGTGTNFVITSDDPVLATTATTGYNYIVGTEQDAVALLAQYREDFLKRQHNRFTICTVTTNTATNIQVWKPADLENEPEDQDFVVYNHTNGLNEPIYGKTTATMRVNELKLQYITDLKLDVLTTVSRAISRLRGETPPTQRISQGVQLL